MKNKIITDNHSTLQVNYHFKILINTTFPKEIGLNKIVF